MGAIQWYDSSLDVQDYVIDHVVNSGEDDDVEPATDEEALIMAERLNDRRVLLAAFLKLPMFQAIDAKMAAPIWGYFITVSVDDISWLIPRLLTFFIGVGGGFSF